MYVVLAIPAILMIGSLLLERLERQVPARTPPEPIRPESGMDGRVT
jgi:hypothetical protein